MGNKYEITTKQAHVPPASRVNAVNAKYIAVIFKDENGKDVSLLLFADKLKQLVTIYEQENSIDNINCNTIDDDTWMESC